MQTTQFATCNQALVPDSSSVQVHAANTHVFTSFHKFGVLMKIYTLKYGVLNTHETSKAMFFILAH